MKFHGLSLLVFSVAALIFFSSGRIALRASWDLVPVYTGARCLVHGCNPYITAQVDQQYAQVGGTPDLAAPKWYRTPLVYPPSTLLVLSPLALLRFPVARLLWFLINGCLFVTAAALVLSLCPRPRRWFALALVSLILATSKFLLFSGNPAAFAIALLAIGIYLFLRNRFLPLAAILLALSLAVKPQMGAFIVLYFIVAKIHWRYAAFAVVGALALLLAAGLVLNLHPRSAGWASTLYSNISATVLPGGINDPRPPNPDSVFAIDLQAVTSVFTANSSQFNTLALAIFSALLAAWIIAFLRTNASLEVHFLLLGALSILTLLAVYHRFYDARLLLISVPAVAIVFQCRRFLGACMGALTLLAVSSMPSHVYPILDHYGKLEPVLVNKFLFILLLRQQTLELVLLFCLYIVALFFISDAPSRQRRNHSSLETERP